MTAMISDSSGAHGKAKRWPRSPGERISAEIRDVTATARLILTDGQAGTAAPMPLDLPRVHRVWVASFLLGVIAGDALGDLDVATRTLLCALDLAGPDQVLAPFLSHSAPGLPDGLARPQIADTALIREMADVLARLARPATPTGCGGRVERSGRSMGEHRCEAVTRSETRVLHYLPTNLSTREIASELHLSVNTVRTHQRHLYQKLGARSRTQAVAQARVLGLLAPVSRGRGASPSPLVSMPSRRSQY